MKADGHASQQTEGHGQKHPHNVHSLGTRRFFYCAKASTAEREAGLDALEAQAFAFSTGARKAIERGESGYGPGATLHLNRISQRRNVHPTVKPLALTEYLARLLLPPRSDESRRMLVPFSGVGSEAIGALKAGWDEVDGIELYAEYVRIATARAEHHAAQTGQPALF